METYRTWRVLKNLLHVSFQILVGQFIVQKGHHDLAALFHVLQLFQSGLRVGFLMQVDYFEAFLLNKFKILIVIQIQRLSYLNEITNERRGKCYIPAVWRILCHERTAERPPASGRSYPRPDKSSKCTPLWGGSIFGIWYRWLAARSAWQSFAAGQQVANSTTPYLFGFYSKS